MDFIIHPSSKEDQINLNSLWFYVASIKNLRIKNFLKRPKLIQAF